MENETKSKVRVKHLDRVSLTPEAIIRLNEWMAALEASNRGIKLAKNDLVSFLIMNHSTELSEREVTLIKERYFDEVRFAEWVIKQLKSAKASGRHLTLNQVLDGAKCPETEPQISIKRLVVQAERRPEKEEKIAD